MKLGIPGIGKDKADSSQGTVIDLAKRSVVVIGYRSAGKTTFMGLLTIHIDYLASIDERISYIFKPGAYDFPLPKWYEILAKLRNGEPLPPTEVTKKPYVGRLVVRYPKLLGSGEFNLPMVDLAGELYHPIMEFFLNSKSEDFDYKRWNEELRERLENLGITKDDLKYIYDFIFKAKAYLILINLDQALSAVSPDYSRNSAAKDDPEIKSLLGRYFNVVVNLVNYRLEREDRPRLGIVLTHYDKANWYIESHLGYNVWEKYDDRMRLMTYIAPEIPNQLRNLNKNVPIFISYYGPRREPPGGIRLPDYPQKEYDAIFDWIKEALK
jgi:hypothetical protein